MLYQSSDQADTVLIHAEIDRIYELIVHALRDSANLTIPRLKTNALKYWWGRPIYSCLVKTARGKTKIVLSCGIVHGVSVLVFTDQSLLIL